MLKFLRTILFILGIFKSFVQTFILKIFLKKNLVITEY